MDPAAPLLFFDSGVGGLSVLGPTRELLPTAPIVYAADSGGFPYGTKSEAEIASFELLNEDAQSILEAVGKLPPEVDKKAKKN